MTDADVLVAGGGPVGLAAAIEARLAGLSAIVAEPRTGPIDKACGEGLMPGALPALGRLGVRPAGFALHGVDYRDGRRSVQHRFAHGHALGVRRTALSAALRARAAELGVGFSQDRVVEVRQDAGGVTAGGLRARWLLGADGLHSQVARETGLARPAPRTRRRFGQRQHFRIEPWTDLIEVHWSPVCEIYVTPTADGSIGLAVLARRGVRYRDALATVPELAERIAGAEPVSDLRGAGPFRQRTRTRVAGRVLLVGDAAGYVDALTGEGIRIGLAQARAAVAALVAGDPARYEREWEEVTREFRRLTGALAGLAASPLRGGIVPAAARLPRVYAGAVERLAR